jgi:hypothetical protein
MEYKVRMMRTQQTAGWLLGVAMGLAAAQAAVAQAAGGGLAAPVADPAIAAALSTVSAANVKADIQTLVSFRTRNTLSSMETGLPEGEGINAAMTWIVAEFGL